MYVVCLCVSSSCAKLFHVCILCAEPLRVRFIRRAEGVWGSLWVEVTTTERQRSHSSSGEAGRTQFATHFATLCLSV